MSIGIWEYIKSTREKVHDLEKRVQKAKDNVEAMSKDMAKWAVSPLYERKDDKKDALLNAEVRAK